MQRTYWSVALGVAAIAAAGVVVSSQRGLAQTRDQVASELADLRQANRLADLPSKRLENADLAVKFNFPDATERERHILHAQLLAPQFAAIPPRFLQYPSVKPRSGTACAADTIYSHGNFAAIIKQHLSDADGGGCEGTYLQGAPGFQVVASNDAFFQSLGTNDRSCATCHQPPSGMSVNSANIVSRAKATHGHDPIFADIDGANCPSTPPVAWTGTGAAFKAAHSLLLKRGVFRVFETLPASTDFTITVSHDPNGCNTLAAFTSDTDPVTGNTAHIVSVYRRPRISAGTGFVATGFASPAPPPAPQSAAAIMWDTREPSLQQQAVDATHGHAQGTSPPSAAQVAQIVAFETLIYSAQSRAAFAGDLGAAGAKGGPITLASVANPQPPVAATTPQISFDEYTAWAGSANARRASIARGEILFNTKPITISNVAGLNNLVGSNQFAGTCSGCHSKRHAGNEDLGNSAILDIGIDGASSAHNGHAPATDLPVFTVTCTGGASTPFNGATVVTNDLGLALQTGKCADIGRYAVPQLRALASRRPYFHDGSAKTLWDVVEFYDKRFTIGLNYQEKRDLVNFLASL